MRNSPNYTIILEAPATQASGMVASEVSDTQLRITWTRGTGKQVLIVAMATASTNAQPQENNTYTANSIFGSGSQLGTANYVVYIGTGTTVLITGLTASTAYTFYAYEYNFAYIGTEKYNVNSATLNPIAQTTLPPQIAPTTQATNLVFVGDRNASCTAGNGTHRLWLYNTGGAINGSFLPVDNTTYTVGQVLGGGNTVGGVGVATAFLITGLPYATSVAHRVFEYNIASGNPKYNTNTATGNPLTQTTIAEPVWYLYHHPVCESTRYRYDIQTVGHIASKSYTGSFCETSTEYLLFVVGDNLGGPAVEFDYDQTFLRIKSKSDGLPFQEGWSWYADGSGEPIPVLIYGYADQDGTSIQNWLATPTVIADNNIVAYYSYNFGNIAARYSVSRATSTDGGRTWTRTGTNISGLPGGQDHYQFQQAIWDTDLNKWVIFSPNARTGSNGRWTSLEVWTSNDGSTGLNFSKIASDIVLDTDIDVNGFGLYGGIWKDSGRYYWQYTAIPLLAYMTNPAQSPSLKAYENGVANYSALQKQVILVSVAYPITSNSRARVEHINYETDQQAITAIFPGSKIISHGGANHIMCSCFLWKPEDNSQISIDVRVLSDAAYTGHGAQTIGRNVYPGYLLRLFKMHQSHLSDVYQSSTTYPIEVITNTALTFGGSGADPTQFNMNMVLNSGKYPQGASFTHSQTAFGVKMSANIINVTDLVTRGIVEKSGTFRITLYEGNKLEVWLYGVGGGIKKYRMSEFNMLAYNNGLFGPIQIGRIGFTAILNGGGTDFDLKLNVNYGMNVPVTKIQDDVFTQIVQNSNDITFGHVGGVTDHAKFIGSCMIMSGTEVSQTNWLEENNV